MRVQTTDNTVANKFRQVFISLLLLTLAAGATFLLYKNRPQAEISEPAAEVVTVDVVSVEKESVRIPVSIQGTVTPLHQTTLVAEVAGRVTEVAAEFNVGGFIDKGQMLLRIDPRDYRTALLRAQAAVASAESALAQEKGRAEVALQEWKKLPAGSQRSDEAKALYLRKPQLAQAKSELLAAQANLDTARDNLERTIIRAPYAAIISSKAAELGQYLAPGSTVATIFSIDYAEVRLPIPQSKLDYLDLPGLAGYEQVRAIDLSVDIGGITTHWQARLHRSEGVFDERSRVLYTVARIEDPYALKHPERPPLRVGTFVNATIEGRQMDDLIVLPRRLLRSGNTLWVIDSDNYLRNRQVEVLRAGREVIYVVSGLKEGERVCLTNLDGSLAGSMVDILSTVNSSELHQNLLNERTDKPAAPTTLNHSP